MILCFLALIVFSFLGIFSKYYRKLAKEAFKCVTGKTTDKKSEAEFNKKIKSKLVAKISKIYPKLNKIISKYFIFLFKL